MPWLGSHPSIRLLVAQLAIAARCCLQVSQQTVITRPVTQNQPGSTIMLNSQEPEFLRTACWPRLGCEIVAGPMDQGNFTEVSTSTSRTYGR